MNLFFLKYDTHVRFVVAKVNCRFEFQIGKFIMLGHHQYYSLTTVTAQVLILFPLDSFVLTFGFITCPWLIIR